MPRKRVRLTVKEVNELTQARDWAALNGLDETVRYYDELLEFHSRRSALPDMPQKGGADVAPR